ASVRCKQQGGDAVRGSSKECPMSELQFPLGVDLWRVKRSSYTCAADARPSRQEAKLQPVYVSCCGAWVGFWHIASRVTRQLPAYCRPPARPTVDRAPNGQSRSG